MEVVNAELLSEKEKKMLFWASFLALSAAGCGFVFRVMLPDIWVQEFNITAEQAGGLAGAALWPIAITMVLFSLLVDVIGYRKSMFTACALLGLSVILTILAKNTSMLWWACFASGLGHGIVEAVINPLCASMYRKDKSKMLNILHASWPAGIVGGGCVYLLSDSTLSWRMIFLFELVPIGVCAACFAMCHRYPVDERVEADISTSEMLREFGGLGAFLAITFLFYEIMNQVSAAVGLGGTALMNNLLTVSVAVGAIGGTIFGFAFKSKGKVLFFILCVIMIPLATAELATDGWIQTLMRPVLQDDFALRSGWAIVASAGIMMFLRFFAGIPLKYMSPPALLLFSSTFSIAGLYLLSGATGLMIFVAFVFYAVGQTFYWPTMLGFVSERFPKGGAMTLNTVSALGLLTVGIFGFPFLGAVKDSFDAKTVKAEAPVLFEKYKIADQRFFGVRYDSIKAGEVKADPSLTPEMKADLTKKIDKSARQTLRVAAVLPLSMAIAFTLIIIWFRTTQGGYKPIHLESASAAANAPPPADAVGADDTPAEDTSEEPAET